MTWVERPFLFRPIAQTAPSETVLLLRTATASAGMAATVQRIVSRQDADVPVSDIQTMRSRIDRNLAYPQFRARALSAFASLALVLAVVGLYGVLSQLVAQRTREIGIRVALGAPRAAVIGLIAKQGMQVAAAGLGVGLVAALWFTRFISAMLYGIEPLDGTIVALVSAALLLSALVATYLPARRATRIDPVVTLRSE